MRECTTRRPEAGMRKKKKRFEIEQRRTKRKEMIFIPKVGWVSQLEMISAASCQASGFIPVVVDLDFGQRWDERCVPPNSEIRPSAVWWGLLFLRCCVAGCGRSVNRRVCVCAALTAMPCRRESSESRELDFKLLVCKSSWTVV